MYLCLRVDLDYVPWDAPEAEEFGHGEPAMTLRLLDLARSTGWKYHFFASERVLRALPCAAEAVLGDGHDLDWLCRTPEEFAQRYEVAKRLFTALGHQPAGLAVRTPWPSGAPQSLPPELVFLSAPACTPPTAVHLFPVQTPLDQGMNRQERSGHAWADGFRREVREAASLNRGATIVVRPQVLAKLDPDLQRLQKVVEMGLAVGLKLRTIRDLVQD